MNEGQIVWMVLAVLAAALCVIGGLATLLQQRGRSDTPRVDKQLAEQVANACEPGPRPVWYTPDAYREQFSSGPCWIVEYDADEPDIAFYSADDQLFRPYYWQQIDLPAGLIRAVRPITVPQVPR